VAGAFARVNGIDQPLMAFQKPLTVRLAALHKAALSSAKAFSIELKGFLGRQVG